MATNIGTPGETSITVIYPSIAAGGLGRLIGSILNSVRVGNINVSAMLFGLPLAPLGATLYLLQKVVGERYELTTHAVKRWGAIGQSLHGDASLAQIGSVEIDQQSGQGFFHAADLVLLDNGGKELLTLPGVSRPDVFRRTILEARDASVQTLSALETIGARQPA